jgi:hypothetical protein
MTEARPAASRLQRTIFVAAAVMVAVLLLEVTLFAGDGASALRRGLTVGIGVALISLVADRVLLSPLAMIAFGVGGVALAGWGFRVAPPQGSDWIWFVLVLAFPLGLAALGAAGLRRRDTA